jgi:hypothetical protein
MWLCEGAADLCVEEPFCQVGAQRSCSCGRFLGGGVGGQRRVRVQVIRVLTPRGWRRLALLQVLQGLAVWLTIAGCQQGHCG